MLPLFMTKTLRKLWSDNGHQLKAYINLPPKAQRTFQRRWQKACKS